MIREENKAKIYYACVVAAYIIISLFAVLLPDKYLTSEMSILLGQSVVVIPGIIYAVANRKDIFKKVLFKKISISNVVLIILLTYAILPVVTLINAISMLFVDNQVVDVLGDLTEKPFLVSLFMVAVLPAVFEEFSFRGIIYTGFRQKSVVCALTMSCMLFGIFHMNINQFLYAAILGIVLVLVMEATGSILGAMIMHFTFNANSVILTYLLKMLEDIAKETDMLTNTEQIAEETVQSGDVALQVIGIYGFISMITGTLAFFLFKFIAKRCGRWEHIKSIFSNRQPAIKENRKLEIQDIISNVLFVVAVIVTITVMVAVEIS